VFVVVVAVAVEVADGDPVDAVVFEADGAVDVACDDGSGK
jgi:hypothetical protein